MNKHFVKTSIHSGRFWIIIGIVAIGLFLRCYRPDNKLFWNDEVVSLVHASNMWEKDTHRLYSNTVITGNDIIEIFSQPHDRNVFDVIKHSTIDSSKRPLYYVLGFWWTRVFTPTFLGLRTLSVFLGVLMLPALWWLYKESFEEELGAILCLAFFAVSPFYVIYSQEARPYMLWYVLTLISSAIFLRALRLNSKFYWLLYLITVMLGMLSFLLFTAVFFGHILYYLFFANRSWIKKIKLITVIFFSLLASSTLYLIWTNKPYFYRIPYIVKKWLSDPYFFDPTKIITGLNRFFIDISPAGGFSIEKEGSRILSVLSIFIFILFVLLIGFAFFTLLKSKIKHRSFFLVMPLSSGAVFLLSQRLMSGLRFYGAAFLFIICVLAFFLGNKIKFETGRKRIIWITITSLILISGVVSSLLQARSKIWWNKYLLTARPLYEFSQYANSSKRPLVISDARFVDIARLPSIMGPKVRYLFIDKEKKFHIPDEYDLFLFNPSPELVKMIANKKMFLIEDLHDEVYGSESARESQFFKIERNR